MGVENGMFRSEIGSGFEDTGGTPPPRIPRSTPPGRDFYHQLHQPLKPVVPSIDYWENTL